MGAAGSDHSGRGGRRRCLADHRRDDGSGGPLCKRPGRHRDHRHLGEWFHGPLHRPLTRGDTLRLTAPVGWTYTPVGVAEAIDQVAENRVGKTNFDVEGTVRTLRLGLGLTPVTQGWGNWLLAANQRMRLALFGATRDSLGAPLTISVSPYRQYFSKAAWSLGNGLDSTDYPGQVGFFAVGWNEHDRINFPITFKITDDLGGTGAPDFSIVERTAYNNPGTQNVSNPNRWDGIVRIFEVTRLPGYTTANVDLFLEVTCPSKNLQFSDFWILGPGDFTLGTPTVLDKSNPRRLAARLVDRMHGVQAIRFMETTIGTAGECPGIEPEDLISDSAFSWGEAYFRYSKT